MPRKEKDMETKSKRNSNERPAAVGINPQGNLRTAISSSVMSDLSSQDCSVTLAILEGRLISSGHAGYEVLQAGFQVTDYRFDFGVVRSFCHDSQ